MWMARAYPHIPFERYADDAILQERQRGAGVMGTLADRFAACKLVLHPGKTNIVYLREPGGDAKISCGLGASGQFFVC